MSGPVVFRSCHNTYLSFQGIGIKTIQTVDSSCYFQLEQYEDNKVALRTTPQGYYVGISPNNDVYVTDSVSNSHLFSLTLFDNGKKALCNSYTKTYIGVDHSGNVRGFKDIEEGVFFEELHPGAPLTKPQLGAVAVPAKLEPEPEPVPVKVAPAPQPVIVTQPAPVYEQPAPVYVQQPTPVYTQPAPVYMQPAPVYVQQPTPVVVQQQRQPAQRSAAVPMLGGFIVGNALGRRRRR